MLVIYPPILISETHNAVFNSMKTSTGGALCYVSQNGGFGLVHERFEALDTQTPSRVGTR